MYQILVLTGNHREKEKEKKRIKRNPNKRSNAEKGKEQDHLKKTSLGPLRQGQRLDTSETKPCSSKEHKPPKQTRTPSAHMQAPPEQVPTLGTNWSGRFPKPVRPVPHSRPHPQNQKCKRKAQAPPWLLGLVLGMQCNFSPPSFPPLVANA
jgi:hypothetical protein